jgi:hypothetical protein
VLRRADRISPGAALSGEVTPMGSMRQKRRRKLARAWAEFQSRHAVSDDVMRTVRMMGFPPGRLEELMAEIPQPPSAAANDRLRALHRQWQERARSKPSRTRGDAADRQVVATGRQGDLEWARAKRLCRLNRADVAMARALGLNPRKLIKNIPSPTQPWKSPVKIWIRELYAERYPKVAGGR